jgi:drug/metabolite transporter (DMT)-like permease
MILAAACFLVYYPVYNLLVALSIPEEQFTPWPDITFICASAFIVLAGVAWLVSRDLGYKRFAGIMLIVAGAILLINVLDNFFSIIQYLTYGIIGNVFNIIQNSAFIAAGVVCLLPATRIRDKNPS